jgi:hypothetical protein
MCTAEVLRSESATLHKPSGATHLLATSPNWRVSVLRGGSRLPIGGRRRRGDADDSVHFGVEAPVSLWKAIDFRHNRTRRLAAIGYRRSQAKRLPGCLSPRFVFSRFKDIQASVTSIGVEAGVGSDVLTEIDVMARAPAMAVELSPVSDLFLAR